MAFEQFEKIRQEDTLNDLSEAQFWLKHQYMLLENLDKRLKVLEQRILSQIYIPKISEEKIEEDKT